MHTEERWLELGGDKWGGNGRYEEGKAIVEQTWEQRVIFFWARSGELRAFIGIGGGGCWVAYRRVVEYV